MTDLYTSVTDLEKNPQIKTTRDIVDFFQERGYQVKNARSGVLANHPELQELFENVVDPQVDVSNKSLPPTMFEFYPNAHSQIGSHVVSERPFHVLQERLQQRYVIDIFDSESYKQTEYVRFNLFQQNMRVQDDIDHSYLCRVEAPEYLQDIFTAVGSQVTLYDAVIYYIESLIPLSCTYPGIYNNVRIEINIDSEDIRVSITEPTLKLSEDVKQRSIVKMDNGTCKVQGSLSTVHDVVTNELETNKRQNNHNFPS